MRKRFATLTAIIAIFMIGLPVLQADAQTLRPRLRAVSLLVPPLLLNE
jgi:hypothetical protein